jgi:glycosyltransferase involved in cell wall biosynthesis
MKKYTILICTYNGVNRIIKTLEYILSLEYNFDLIEIIIVDNASNDNLEEIVKFFFSTYSNIDWRLLRENRIGKSNALWTGFCESKAEYIVVCDDDNWLNSDFLKVADSTISEFGKEVILGSSSTPVFDKVDTEVPYFFYSNTSWFAVGSATIELQDITESRGWVFGAGSVFPRTIIIALMEKNFKQKLSCRKGSQLSSGGDVELCLAASLLGYSIISQPLMRFKHYIPNSRLDLNYLKALLESNKSEKEVLLSYQRLRKIIYMKRNFENVLKFLIIFLRKPDKLNWETIKFLFFYKRCKFDILPVYLLK